MIEAKIAEYLLKVLKGSGWIGVNLAQAYLDKLEGIKDENIARKIYESGCMTLSKAHEILPKIKSVYLNLGKVKGKFRQPEKIEYLAGENNPIVEHREHGIRYIFDITKIMFSKGNLSERKYLATLVKEGEIIVDMFAGIGYFSLPIAKHSPVEKIYSIELNPDAYKVLVNNIKLNHFEEKIVPVHGDCRKEVVRLSESGLRADRVIMGVFPAPNPPASATQCMNASPVRRGRCRADIVI